MVLFLPRIMRIGRMSVLWRGSEQNINQDMMHHIELHCLEGSTPEDREGLSLFIALRWMQDRGGVMMWLTENIQACLRDFLAATASMARKRHLTSIARGLFGFCLAPSIRKLISTDERVPFFPSVEVKEKGYKL